MNCMKSFHCILIHNNKDWKNLQFSYILKQKFKINKLIGNRRKIVNSHPQKNKHNNNQNQRKNKKK